MTEIVRALVYSVAWADDVDYERAPRVQVETNDFDLELFGRELRATLKREYSSIEQARRQVEDYLHSWEIVIGITEHPDAVRFVYEQAEVDEERIDPQTGHRLLQSAIQITTSANLSATARVSRGRYPHPPDRFHADSIVEALYARYSLYEAGRELLTSMAYFCLTVIEASTGSRSEAAKEYRIAKPVLDLLGLYCSERGSKEQARKAPKARNHLAFIPLSQIERQWVLATVRLFIKRAGEVAACPGEPIDEITMRDLPSLPKLP